jgi:hypothetical protein
MSQQNPDPTSNEIDGSTLPPGWGFISPEMKARRLLNTVASITCPTEAAMTWARGLRDAGCSWTEIERITGVNRAAYGIWARRRKRQADE